MCRLSTGASPAPKAGSGFGARMASLLGVSWPGILSPPVVASGPAQITAPKSKPDGKSILTPERLFRRGLLLHNRRKAGARQYAAVHLEMMGKGACYDA